MQNTIQEILIPKYHIILKKPKLNLLKIIKNNRNEVKKNNI